MLCLLYYIILYYIILYYIILYYIILYYIILYYIILYYNTIILWDHGRICGPSLTEMSLYGTYLYFISLPGSVRSQCYVTAQRTDVSLSAWTSSQEALREASV